jgi:hypothetical protein
LYYYYYLLHVNMPENPGLETVKLEEDVRDEEKIVLFH